MPAGRPSKLTPELLADVITQIKAGNYREVVAKACGFGGRTFVTWMGLGKKFPDGLYGEFRRGVLKAEAEAETALVNSWSTIAFADWQAAARFLATKYPDRWSSDRKRLRDLEKRLAKMESDRGQSAEAT